MRIISRLSKLLAYKGETPTKAEDDKYTYTFGGWYPEVAPLTADAVFEAEFFRSEKPTTDTETSAADDTTAADDTQATTDTKAETSATVNSETTPTGESGCGSVVGGGAIMLVAVMGGAAVIARKRKED